MGGDAVMSLRTVKVSHDVASTRVGTQDIVRDKVKTCDPNVHITTDPHRTLIEALTVGIITILMFGKYEEQEIGVYKGKVATQFQSIHGHQTRYPDFPPRLALVTLEISKLFRACPNLRTRWEEELRKQCTDWDTVVSPKLAYTYLDVYNGMFEVISMRQCGTEIDIFLASDAENLYIGNIFLVRVSERIGFPWGINRAITIASQHSKRQCNIKIAKVSHALFDQVVASAKTVGIQLLVTWPLAKGAIALKQFGFEEAINEKREEIEGEVRNTRFGQWVENNKSFPLLSLLLVS